MRCAGMWRTPQGLALILIGLYGINYFVTPEMVGVAKLEICCRPRGQMKFDAEHWGRTTPTSGERYAMVDDLLVTKAIINLDAEHIERLLGKPDLITEKEDERLLFYILGYQMAQPSRSIWWPGRFPNQDKWMLEIQLRGGRAYSARVFFT